MISYCSVWGPQCDTDYTVTIKPWKVTFTRKVPVTHTSLNFVHTLILSHVLILNHEYCRKDVIFDKSLYKKNGERMMKISNNSPNAAMILAPGLKEFHRNT